MKIGEQLNTIYTPAVATQDLGLVTHLFSRYIRFNSSPYRLGVYDGTTGYRVVRTELASEFLRNLKRLSTSAS